MQKTSLSITAYKCRICEKRKNEDLLTMEEEVETKIDLGKTIKEYVQVISESQIGKNSNRTIRLAKPLKIDKVGEWTKFSIYTKSGKLGEDFDVYNHSTRQNTFYSGSDNSAMYSQRTYCFLNNKTGENIFIFFRYGLGGCKTAFQETLNQFLSVKKLIAHFDIQTSGAMFDDDNKCYPEKISLVSQYVPISSDSAENMKKQKKQISTETIVYLDSPRATNMKDWFHNRFRHKPTLDELKSVAILDNFGEDFDEAYVTLKIGNASRKIRVQEFAGAIAEYDITNKVEYFEDGKTFKEESLDNIVNDYAFSFFE